MKLPIEHAQILKICFKLDMKSKIIFSLKKYSISVFINTLINILIMIIISKFLYTKNLDQNLILILISLIITSGFLNYFAQKYCAKIENQTTTSYRRYIENKNINNYSDFTLEFNHNSKALAKYLSQRVVAIIQTFIIPIPIVITMLYYDLLSGFLVILAFFITGLFMMLSGQFLKEKISDKWAQIKDNTQLYVETIRNLDTIKSLNLKEKTLLLNKINAYKLKEKSRQALKSVFVITFTLEFFLSISTAIIAVSLGLRLLEHNLSLETATIIILLLPFAFSPLRNLGSSKHVQSEALEIFKPNSSSERIFNISQAIKDSSLTTEKDFDKTQLKQKPFKLILFFLACVSLATLSIGFQQALLISSASLMILAHKTASISYLHINIAIIRFLGLSVPIIKYFEKLSTHFFSLEIMTKVKIMLINYFFNLDTTILKQMSSANILHEIADKISDLEQQIVKSIFGYLSLSIIIIGLILLTSFDEMRSFLPISISLFVLLASNIYFLKFKINSTYQLEENKQQLTPISFEVYEHRDELKKLGQEAKDRFNSKKDNLLDKLKNIQNNFIKQRRIEIGFFTIIKIFALGYLVLKVQSEIQYKLAAVFIINALSEILVQMGSSNEALAQIIVTFKKTFNKIISNQLDIEENTEKLDEFTNEDYISITKLSVKYPNTHETALDDINLDIPCNKKTLIIGKSGCGKTTLINAITGFVPFKGQIKLIQNANHLKHNYFIDDIAYQSQNSALFNVSIKENLELICSNINRIEELLDLLDLSKLDYSSGIGENGALLSGGERQRLILARTFLQDKEIIILDEPFNNLNEELREKIWDYINKIKKTFIIVSHNTNDIELADNLIKLN